MRQFLLFEGTFYYPAGGWEDFIGSFDDPESAIAFHASKPHYDSEWAHVVDIGARKIVRVYDGPDEGWRSSE